jgi:hypothetical protein
MVTTLRIPMTLSTKFSIYVDDTCYLSIHNFVQMGAVHTRSFNWLIHPVNVAFHEAFTENARVTAPARNRHFGPLSALPIQNPHTIFIGNAKGA